MYEDATRIESTGVVWMDRFRSIGAAAALVLATLALECTPLADAPNVAPPQRLAVLGGVTEGGYVIEKNNKD